MTLLVKQGWDSILSLSNFRACVPFSFLKCPLFYISFILLLAMSDRSEVIFELYSKSRRKIQLNFLARL